MCSNITLIGSVLFYFGFILLINFGNTELCEECITPNSENQKGWCVPAKHCPIIGNIIGNPRILSSFPSDKQQFIKNSKCSSDGAENYCCTEALIEPKFNKSSQFCNVSISQKIDTNTNTEIFQSPIILNGTNYEPSTFDLDAHPNLKLLPENENCGFSGRDGDRISFGNMTDISEFPFMALLQYERNKTDVFRCGGTLINKNYVLTAAHCIKSSLFSVRLGEHDLDKEMDCQNYNKKKICNDPVQNIPIAEIHVHNFVHMTKANDIALIRLQRPANTTVYNVGFVCLPTTAELREQKIPRGNIAGWGQTEKDVTNYELVQIEGQLLKGSVDVNKERQKCVESYKKFYNISINEKYLCAIGTQGANTTDTCSGDSGGPLIARSNIPGEPNERFVQYGIVSAGPQIPCGSVHDIGGAIYTNVPTYMRWILDKMRA